MTARETFVHPTNATAGARSLSSTGSSFWNRWTELKARIEGLNEDRPWGDDEPGRRFSEQYTGGEEGNAAQMTLDAAHSQALILKDLGGDVIEAVNGTMDSDELIEKWFKTE
jgi:hypothetical protein